MRLPRLSAAERRLAILFALALPLAQPALRGEGNGHYAWAASLLVDRDVDVENQYRNGDPDFVAATFRRADGGLWTTMESPTGRARNQFSVGPALAWLPALIETHLLVTLARDFGFEARADGYSRAYLWTAALTTAALGSVGLLFGCRLAASVASPPAAVLATLGGWLASSLPVYLYALPFYAHALSAFAIALFLGHWRFSGTSWTLGRWAAWGALAALMIQMDPLAASFLAIAALEWIRQARADGSPARAGANAAAFGAVGLLTLAPQLVVYTLAHGSPFDGGRFHRFFWDEPRLLDHAFGSAHGAFLWTPLILIAVLGLPSLARRERFFGGSLLLAAALFFYGVACSDRWHVAPGFGNRFLVPLTPVWIVGLAAALESALGWLGRATGAAAARGVMAAGLALAAAWNAGLVFQWGTGLIDRREAVDFAQVARQQFTRVPARIVELAQRRLGAAGAIPDAALPPESDGSSR